MKNRLLSLITIIVVSLISSVALAQEARKAILITGASSGIGRNMAETFAAKGFHVYAGARSQQDIDALNAIENIQAVRLDVTSQEEIDAAAAFIKSQGKGLYGLINNAGVAVVGPLIEVDEDDMQFQMDVNLFGPYRVTKAMAPMIIESKGRITTTGSISGIGAWSFGGPYTMSKHAVEAFGDSLALEMEQFDVKVSIIEPGNYQSSIASSFRQRMQEQGQTTEGSLYAEQWTQFLDAPADRAQYKEPDEVSAAALHFMTSDKPLQRYMVVPEESEADWTIRQAIRELVQLNEWQAYKYDRETLIRMLDEAMGDAQGMTAE